MLRKAKKKWLEALRSGKYKQGSGYLSTGLRDGGREYCCLGVLVESELGKESWETSLEYESYLPKYLREKLRISHREEEYLAGLNDNGDTFDDIAKYIEEEL